MGGKDRYLGCPQLLHRRLSETSVGCKCKRLHTTHQLRLYGFTTKPSSLSRHISNFYYQLAARSAWNELFLQKHSGSCWLSRCPTEQLDLRDTNDQLTVPMDQFKANETSKYAFSNHWPQSLDYSSTSRVQIPNLLIFVTHSYVLSPLAPLPLWRLLETTHTIHSLFGTFSSNVAPSSCSGIGS
ncbi:hypothetical protein M426DRAFT_138931 [Hypoxylon sp. CI-4A]|nr:hypothetical protein M426DRAFT_138931 [Hypoxylon sp. CI-4A]